MKKVNPRDLVINKELDIKEEKWNGYHGRQDDYRAVKKTRLPIFNLED